MTLERKIYSTPTHPHDQQHVTISYPTKQWKDTEYRQPEHKSTDYTPNSSAKQQQKYLPKSSKPQPERYKKNTKS